MVDHESLPIDVLKKFGCTEIEEVSGGIRLILPKLKDEDPTISLAVPTRQLAEFLYGLEQVTQFGKLPYKYQFEISPGSEYVIKGTRGIQVRMSPDPKLSKLWEQEPNGWVRDGNSFVKILGLHQSTQPNHIFGLLPKWLSTMTFTQLHEDRDSEIGEVVDNIAGVRYKMTTGMRHEIFTSEEQLYDQTEISEYFASKYSDKKLP